MLTLFHHPMVSGCRFLRLVFKEFDEEMSLIEEAPWARRREFLRLNPAGAVPVLLAEGDQPVCGVYPIFEYVEETRGPLNRNLRFFSDDARERAEIRRLMEWYLVKLDEDVTRHLVRERVFKLQMPGNAGGGSPDSSALRAARANIAQHLKYTAWLIRRNGWIAGDKVTYADLAAASAISILDYLGEIKWADNEVMREWYARIKSRPSFRPILSDRVLGLSPVAQYADLDF